MSILPERRSTRIQLDFGNDYCGLLLAVPVKIGARALGIAPAAVAGNGAWYTGVDQVDRGIGTRIRDITFHYS